MSEEEEEEEEEPTMDGLMQQAGAIAKQLYNKQFHPLANEFPLMSEDELQELADDIKQNGLREKIVTHEGKILDGRNRYLALKKLDRMSHAYFTKLTEEGDPVSFVISKNIMRRHLTGDQRAMIGANLYEKLPKEKQGGDRKPFGQKSPISEDRKLPSAKSQKQKVATQMKVSTKKLERAAAVKKKDAKKAAEVQAGSKKLVEAEQELKAAAATPKELKTWDENEDLKDFEEVAAFIPVPDDVNEYLSKYSQTGLKRLRDILLTITHRAARFLGPLGRPTLAQALEMHAKGKKKGKKK